MLLNQIHAAHTVARTSIAGSARCQAIGRILVVVSCQLQSVSWQFVAESCTSGTAEAYICRMIHHEWVAAFFLRTSGPWPFFIPLVLCKRTVAKSISQRKTVETERHHVPGLGTFSLAPSLVVRRQMQLMCDYPFIVRSVHGDKKAEAETIQN